MRRGQSRQSRRSRAAEGLAARHWALTFPNFFPVATDVLALVLNRRNDFDVAEFVGAAVAVPRHHVAVLAPAALRPFAGSGPNRPPLSKRQSPGDFALYG